MASGKRKQNGMSTGRMAMLVIVIGLLIGIAFIVKNIISLTIEKRELMEKQNELSNKRDELTAELENVNDLDYIEEQARKLLHMIKPGEILYILDGNGNADANSEGNGIGLPEAPVSNPEPTNTEEAVSEESSEENPEATWEESSEVTWEESSEETWEENTEATWEETPAEAGEEGDWDSGDEGSDG